MTGISPLEGSHVRRPHRSLLVPAACVVPHDRASLPEGVYVGYWGPNYETPAEIRAFRVLGGDLVGMSTVLEAIAARAAGVEVLGPLARHEPGRGPRRARSTTKRCSKSAAPQATAPARSSPRSSRTRSSRLAQFGWLSSMRLPDGSRTKP